MQPARERTGLRIGICGHLLIDAASRNRVAIASARWCHRLLDELGGQDLILLSGLAPGADMLVTQVILDVARQRGRTVKLTALLVGESEDILSAWQARAAELDQPLSDSTRQRMAERLDALLAQAEQIERVDQPDDQTPLQFQRLAARLVLDCDELICVLRPGYSGKDGGAAQIAHWRRDPSSIPATLGADLPVPSSHALTLIDPDTGRVDEERPTPPGGDALEREIRDHLAAGNPLEANDLAMRALERGRDTDAVRYLYLRSLAESGGTTLALQHFEDMAPAPERRSEDWAALPARLHKDLALQGDKTQDNLAVAARLYAQAHESSGGAYTAINAGSMFQLLGDDDSARRYGEKALGALPAEPPASEIERYYWHATQAEAFLLTRQPDRTMAALQQADPLLRDDLTTRSRTRLQLRRLCTQMGLDTGLVKQLAMPYIYQVQGLHRMAAPPQLDSQLRQAISGSPCFAVEPESPAELAALVALVDKGCRLHLILSDSESRETLRWQDEFGAATQEQWQELLRSAERVSGQTGFMPVEQEWRKRQAQRRRDGLAWLSATALDVETRTLKVSGQGSNCRWVVGQTRLPPRQLPEQNRRMVGLIFTDMVAFSRLSDSEVQIYWTQIVPHLAQCLRGSEKAVLYSRTWGDAMHVVTTDASSAARISLQLVEAAREIRKDFSGRLNRLQIRVGAHFAPVFDGYDPIGGHGTYYGSQLSFAARVEPVTPPDTVFVTEAFAAELALEANDRFRLAYAGEVQLAKRYGRFRLFSLSTSPSNSR